MSMYWWYGTRKNPFTKFIMYEDREWFKMLFSSKMLKDESHLQAYLMFFLNARWLFAK